MTTILGALLGLMMPLATPEQYQRPPADNANNNPVNRAVSAPPGEDARFAHEPEGTATPRSQGKDGDQRGQAPEGRRKRRHRKHKAPRTPRSSSTSGMAS